MGAHFELLEAIKDYMIKKEAFDGDDCPGNQLCDADKRLAAAIEASEKETRGEGTDRAAT